MDEEKALIPVSVVSSERKTGLTVDEVAPEEKKNLKVLKIVAL